MILKEIDLPYLFSSALGVIQEKGVPFSEMSGYGRLHLVNGVVIRPMNYCAFHTTKHGLDYV